MLTSDLYWRDSGPLSEYAAGPWKNRLPSSRGVVAILRLIQSNTIFNVAVAHVVRTKSTDYLGPRYRVEFDGRYFSGLKGIESPLFDTIDEAKAYAHMTCLLTLKEKSYDAT
jgi:hypothetical protein